MSLRCANARGTACCQGHQGEAPSARRPQLWGQVDVQVMISQSSHLPQNHHALTSARTLAPPGPDWCHLPGMVGKQTGLSQTKPTGAAAARAKAFISLSGQWASTKRQTGPGSRVGFGDCAAE